MHEGFLLLCLLANTCYLLSFDNSHSDYSSPLKEENLEDFWNNIKHTNIHIIWSQKKRDKGAENLFEKKKKKKNRIMAENFPKLLKETDIQVQEAESQPR